MRISKETLALALLLVTAPGLLLAAEPIWVAVMPDTGPWVDSASVKHVDGKILAWFVHNTTKPEVYPYAGQVFGETYKSTANLYSIDCKLGRWAELQSAYYTEPKMTGDFIGGTTTPDSVVSFSYPIPGTVGSADVAFACDHFASKP